MTTLKRLFTCAVAIAMVALWATPAIAADAGFTTTRSYRNSASANTFNILEGVALNATEATRTVTVELAGRYSHARVGVSFTWAAASTVVLTPYCSQDNGTSYLPVTARSVTAGAGAISPLVDTYTTSGASADFSIEYGVSGCTHFRIVFSGASGGASDLIGVQLSATVGG